MTPLSITLNLEIDPWRDLTPAVLPLNTGGGLSANVERIGLLPNATQQGRASVLMLLRLPDGRSVVAETTFRLFQAAALALNSSPIAQMEEL